MTTSIKILWRSGAGMVTDKAVKTRFATVSLADVDLVEIGLPLIGGAAPLAIACTLLGLRFSDVLTFGELVSVVGFGWLVLCAALLIARITLHSYSINGLAITMPVWRALAMRRAIDAALADKSRSSPTTSRRTM